MFRTKKGSQPLNWASINFPKVGDLARKVNIGRITRTFGTLLSSGVPILEAINITKDITGNVYFAKALSNIHDAVRDGESLSAPMTREKVFPNMVTSMVDVGEETGELAEMLNRVADNYDEDVDNAVAGHHVDYRADHDCIFGARCRFYRHRALPANRGDHQAAFRLIRRCRLCKTRSLGCGFFVYP